MPTVKSPSRCQITAMDDVKCLYERYILENPDSKISLVHFQQIWKCRQAELMKKPLVKDIPVDEKVLYKTDTESRSITKADDLRIQNWRRTRKEDEDREFSKLLAKLHQQLQKSSQDNLKQMCTAAMQHNPPTMSMSDFANKTVDLCREQISDEEVSLEIEVGLREHFANVLAVPLDSFGSGDSRIILHFVQSSQRFI
jgi:hypothetical protein